MTFYIWVEIPTGMQDKVPMIEGFMRKHGWEPSPLYTGEDGGMDFIQCEAEGQTAPPHPPWEELGIGYTIGHDWFSRYPSLRATP